MLIYKFTEPCSFSIRISFSLSLTQAKYIILRTDVRLHEFQLDNDLLNGNGHFLAYNGELFRWAGNYTIIIRFQFVHKCWIIFKGECRKVNSFNREMFILKLKRKNCEFFHPNIQFNRKITCSVWGFKSGTSKDFTLNHTIFLRGILLYILMNFFISY